MFEVSPTPEEDVIVINDPATNDLVVLQDPIPDDDEVDEDADTE